MSDQYGQRDRRVKEHYERWPFPGSEFLSREGLLLLRYVGKWIGGEPQPGGRARIVDVGCGTGQTTLALARNFPRASFLGLDVSRASIRAARIQARRMGLANAAFRECDLRVDLTSLGEFAVVLCLGVLHHLEEPKRTFGSLVRLAAPGGYVVLWLYGKKGRFHHRMNQRFLKMLTKGAAAEESLDVARAFIEDLGPRFAVDSGFYTPKGSGDEGLAWLLKYPQWMADQLIPPFERAVTINEIFRLFRENRLEFWKWLGVPLRLDGFRASPRLQERFDHLSPRDRIVALDYLFKPAYYFVVGRKPDRT